MKIEYDKSIFDITDLYDLRLEEYNAYRKEYKENNGHYYADGVEFGRRETPQKYRERLLGNLKRGEKFILVKYKGNAETVTVPEGVAGLRAYAFAKNEFVKKLYIPDSVDFIGNNAFSNCTALQEIRLGERLGAIYAGIFENCTALNSIAIPDSVKAIGSNAFDGCTALSDVRLGKNLKSIGWDAFARCKSLRHMDLPELLEGIGLNAFYDSGLEKIHIPKNVKSLSGSAFAKCHKLCKVSVDPMNEHYYSRDNCVYHTKNKSLVVGRNDGTLPDDGSLTCIYSDAFAGNPFVTELTIPKGVTDIGSAAFRGCVNLRRVSFPNTLKTIGNCAFEGCTALTKVVLPRSIRKVGNLAFYESGVRRVIKKLGAKGIDDNAFEKCPTFWNRILRRL